MPRPGPTDRVAIIGRTGSGKSQFACDFLATRNWLQMPWVILDYKGEDLIEEIGAAMPRYFRDMKVTDPVPKKPGLYRVRLLPDQDEEVEALMLRIWERGSCGVYVDEGYMLPQQMPRWRGYTYLLTQGRSKRIPMIVLYQRPVWMNKFAIEQADYFAVFQLNGDDDTKTVMKYVKPAVGFTGQIISPNNGLGRFQCIWYDVREGRSVVLRPARSRAEIIQAFAAKASPSQVGQRGEAKDRAFMR